MKNIKKSISILAVLTVMLSLSGLAQSRLPDGTIIYKDGSRRLPNGTVVYPNRTNRNTSTINRTIDGVLHPNRTTTVYNNRYPRRSANNAGWIPPGQAKKMYGGNARDYAPGHNKNRDNDNDRKEGDNDRQHGDHHHGNGHDDH